MDSLQLLWEMILGMVQMLRFLWPLTAFILIMSLIKVGVYIYKRHRLAKSGIADIDKLNGKEFEQYLETFFRKLGYQVKRTPYQGDYGADLVLQQGDEKTVVQAKRYNGSVGVKAVQEAVASKEYYGCEKAMVVTNSHFSRQAQTLAKANQVELWGREQLVSRLLSSQSSNTIEFASTAESFPNQRGILQPAAYPSSASTCAKCGRPVSAQVQNYCVAHAETFHGSVYCYEHQKEVRRFKKAI